MVAPLPGVRGQSSFRLAFEFREGVFARVNNVGLLSIE